PGPHIGGEGLRVDYHAMQPAILAEGGKLAELAAVINEVPDLVTVERMEPAFGILERLLYPFADRDTRHDDDEFRPAIFGVEPVHGVNINIGLAGAGLHLDIEIDRGGFARRQLAGRWQMLRHLHFANVA